MCIVDKKWYAFQNGSIRSDGELKTKIDVVKTYNENGQNFCDLQSNAWPTNCGEFPAHTITLTS